MMFNKNLPVNNFSQLCDTFKYPSSYNIFSALVVIDPHGTTNLKLQDKCLCACLLVF